MPARMAAASATASGKFLVGLQTLAAPVANIKLWFWEFVEAISEAQIKAAELRKEFLQMIGIAAKNPSFEDVFSKYRNKPSEAPLPPTRPGAEEATAGESRARYQAYADAKKKAGATAQSQIETYIESLKKAEETAKAELATWGMGNVERAKAVALVAARTAAEKEGRGLTDAEVAKVEALATAEAKAKDQLAALKTMQQEINGVFQGFASTIETAFNSALIKGEKMKAVLQLDERIPQIR